MNLRKSRRQIKRNKAWTLFGERVLFTVRVPVRTPGLFPVPEPPQYHPGEGYRASDHVAGMWTNEGTAEGVYIHKMSVPPGADLHLVATTNPVRVRTDKKGTTWWEGARIQGEARTPLPEKDVEKYATWAEWAYTYLAWRWDTDDAVLSPILRVLKDAARDAQTHHAERKDGYLYVTYAVKVHYAESVRRAVVQAVRTLRRMGVEVKLV